MMIDQPQKTPVFESVAFLMGAGRSGTTLLYKLLCLHSQIAYISNYDNRLPWLPTGMISRFAAQRTGAKVNAWFNQGGNAYFIKRPWAKKLFPTPVEGESIYESCGIPLYPSADYRPNDAHTRCLRQRFEKIRSAAGCRILLSKRTANNRRLPQLNAIFPEAKYIHLVRDGREVANSLSRVEWWDDHTLWWDGRTAIQMEQEGVNRLTICAKNWVYEMQELKQGLASIPRSRVLEIRYESLLSEPLVQLAEMLKFLGLEFTDEYRDAITSLGLRYKSVNWSERWTPEQMEMVLREEQSVLREYGYV